MGILTVSPELLVAGFGLGEFILQVIHCGRVAIVFWDWHGETDFLSIW